MRELLRQLNIILTKKQRRNFLILLLGSVFVAFLDTFAVAMMGPFTTALTTDAQTMQGNLAGQAITAIFGPQSARNTVIIMSILLIGVYLVRGVVKVAYNLAQAMVVAKARTELSHRLFDFVMHQPYRYHVRHNTAETQRLVSGDVSNCFSAINSIMMTVSCGLVGAGILLMLLKLNLVLTLAILAWIVVLLVGMKTVLRAKIKKAADVQFKANADMNKWVTQAIGNLKMCLVKNTQNYYVQSYFSSAKKAANVQAYYEAIDGVPKVLIDTCCMVLLFGVVLVEALMGRDIASELSTFVVYAIAALRLIPMVNQVAATINSIGFMRPSINIVCDVLESGELQTTERARTQQKEDACAELKTHGELHKGISVEHVSFKFDDSKEYLFEDVNLTIPARKSVAFVGPTGAGKTTMADIILGLQPLEKGKITADGYDVRENPQWWAKMVGYIPQTIYLLDSSVRENIAVGDICEKTDDGWIWECLDRAQMKEFVQSLPDGLDTNIGENGIRLSGGQRQRIGIARALYSRPQFLLMDEATSALDNETEKAIVESINQLSGDITMLVIAHRLTTIEDCDIIYRVEDGRVICERKTVKTQP